MNGKIYITWRAELENTLVFYKTDRKKRKYVECYDFSPDHTLLVKEKLSYLDLETPNNEIQKVFDGICKLRIREKYEPTCKEKRIGLLKGLWVFVLNSTGLFLYGALFGLEILVILMVCMGLALANAAFLARMDACEDDD